MAAISQVLIDAPTVASSCRDQKNFSSPGNHGDPASIAD
jgi:hypothetical protein